MKVMSGIEVAKSIREKIQQQRVRYEATYGCAPMLCVVLVGNNGPSETYVRNKLAACTDLGIACRDIHLPEDTTQQQLLEVIRQQNEDPQVNGLLVQLPLPPAIDEDAIIDAIDPAKDVDGFHPINVGNLLIGKKSFVSCTPQGVLAMLDYYDIPTACKHVCVVGRSNIVGKPMAALLMQQGRDATVTVCNSKTPDLQGILKQADIIISAMGRPHTITSAMVKPGAVVVDVGTTRVADATKKKGWRLCGDVDYEHVCPICQAISPVPGGVGPMTITMLMNNTMLAARRQAGEDC